MGRFKFGDIVENGWASDSNPTKRGIYLWSFNRTGRMNPGKHVKLLHDDGRTGELRISDDDKMTVVGTIFDAKAAEAIAAKDAEIEAAHAETNRLRGLIEEAVRCLDGEPEYHEQGMGCGLEDRGITDRYDAMAHGWEQAMERVYGENIAWAKDALASALKEQADA